MKSQINFKLCWHSSECLTLLTFTIHCPGALRLDFKLQYFPVRYLPGSDRFGKFRIGPFRKLSEANRFERIPDRIQLKQNLFGSNGQTYCLLSSPHKQTNINSGWLELTCSWVTLWKHCFNSCQLVLIFCNKLLSHEKTTRNNYMFHTSLHCIIARG